MHTNDDSPVVIYEYADKSVEVRLDTEQNTVWLTLLQIAEVLGRDKSIIYRHLRRTCLPEHRSEGAHLLYFTVKNHPFSDGNKRSAAYLFVDFLYRNDRLLNDNGDQIINNVGLAALTLLVAQSDPANKETMVRLNMNMLARQEMRDALRNNARE